MYDIVNIIDRDDVLDKGWSNTQLNIDDKIPNRRLGIGNVVRITEQRSVHKKMQQLKMGHMMMADKGALEKFQDEDSRSQLYACIWKDSILDHI